MKLVMRCHFDKTRRGDDPKNHYYYADTGELVCKVRHYRNFIKGWDYDYNVCGNCQKAVDYGRVEVEEEWDE